MRVFISSVIRDFGAYRDAAAQAITELGHEVLRAETLRASDATPEQACLQLERQADAVVLLLGERYGPVQQSGLSATHEEYRDARDQRSVLVFVQDGVTPEEAQRKFIDEARHWAGGRVTSAFTTPDSLRQAVTRAVHDLDLARAAGAADPGEMVDRARRALNAVPTRGQGHQLIVSVAAGPRQQLLRPAQLESEAMRESTLRLALVGSAPVFDTRAATDDRLSNGSLVLQQTRAQLRLDGEGTVTVIDPALRVPQTTGHFAGMVIIEEDVREGIFEGLRFAGALLDEIDHTRRAGVVAPVAALLDIGHTEWRTRAAHNANPNTYHPNMFGPERVFADLMPLTRPRAALTHQTEELAEDLFVVLRRQARERT
jgi:hypothetical protein